MSTSAHDVVIIGAGLAGLRAAQVLSGRGLDVVVVDQAGHLGGRMHSFDLDGFVIDEGFQLINPSYPELRATGVVKSLDLRKFPGLLTYVGTDTRWTLADPRRFPLHSLAAFVAGHPSPRDAWRLTRLFAGARFASARHLLAVPDSSTRTGLLNSGITEGTIDDLLAPFLRGTLLDDNLDTSWRYTRLLIKSFASGLPSTPAAGVRQLPQALRESMPDVNVRLGERVLRVGPTSLQVDAGELHARAVIVATDLEGATTLLDAPSPGWRSTTTWWFSTPRVVQGERLRLDVGPRLVASMLDLASVAPERAPQLRSLIAVAANGLHEERRNRDIASEVARFYELDCRDVELLIRTPVEHALPRVGLPLNLARSPRRGELFVAGDYLQTPSIQGALVSGRRAASAVLDVLGLGAT